MKLAAGGMFLPALAESRLTGDAFATQARKPNIILALADDQGWLDLGCYGHSVLKTPCLDRLAGQGCRFTNFYVSSPVCSPSRAGCLTGRIPNRFNMQEVIYSGLHPSGAPVFHHLPTEEPTFARQLKKAGYRTCHIGKWHLSHLDLPGEPAPSDYGFDHYLVVEGGGRGFYRDPTGWNRNGKPVEGKPADWAAELYTDEAIRFIEASRDQPFFINYWTLAPHEPLDCADSYKRMYADRTEAEQTYFGAITQQDEQFGRLLDYLDSRNLSDNTIIVFTSDNGPEIPGGADTPESNPHPGATWSNNSRGATPFRGRKHDIYEGGVRVPGIIRWPGLTRPGSVSHTPVSTLDLFPTFCLAAAAPLPENVKLDGGDFRPALDDKPVARPHPLYWQFNYSRSHRVWGVESPPLAVREGAWKLYCDENFSSVELHNLDTDPTEHWNYARAHPRIAEKMLDDLKAIHKDVNRPYPRERYLNQKILEMAGKPE